MDARTALNYIAQDEKIMIEILQAIDSLKFSQRKLINDIIERYLTSSLSDSNGYIIPSIIKDDLWNTIETELLSIYTPESLDQTFIEIIQQFNRRLITIDDLMNDLGLENAILGNTIFEIDTVVQRASEIAKGLVRGANGEGEYIGSIKRVQDSILRYKLDTTKPEFVLRTELMDTLIKDAGAGVNHANSVAITSTMSVDRDLKRSQAEKGGIQHGLYSGPFDDVIRKFCNTWLGKVQEYSFWDKLSNDMPVGLFDYPVSIYAGGINCRHRIIPWMLSWSNGEMDLRDTFALSMKEMIKTLTKDQVDYLRYLNNNHSHNNFVALL